MQAAVDVNESKKKEKNVFIVLFHCNTSAFNYKTME